MLVHRAVAARAKLMGAMDEINARFGRNMVFLAAMGVERGWRSDRKSPCYTTRIEELPIVQAWSIVS